MLRVTGDVVELRRWAESRGGRPCREAGTGRLRLEFGGGCGELEVGWEEFEPNFCAGRCVFVYDDAPGAVRWFIGSEADAHEYVERCERRDLDAAPPPP